MDIQQTQQIFARTLHFSFYLLDYIVLKDFFRVGIEKNKGNLPI